MENQAAIGKRPGIVDLAVTKRLKLSSRTYLSLTSLMGRRPWGVTTQLHFPLGIFTPGCIARFRVESTEDQVDHTQPLQRRARVRLVGRARRSGAASVHVARRIGETKMGPGIPNYTNLHVLRISNTGVYYEP